MRILFFTHYFPPEVNAPATRTFEHCRQWVRAGHEVHVVTCVPSHPRGVAYQPYRMRWYQREEMAGITVHRVWTRLAANEGVLRRSVNYLSFVPTALWRALRLGRFDVMVGTSPQFFCAVATAMAARLTRTPWAFEVRDLWPESISAVGAIGSSWPMRILQRLESAMYRSATAVVCVTQSFVDHVRRRGVAADRVHWVPNGIDAAFWHGASRQRGRAWLGVDDRTLVASYVGTIGLAHGLETVLLAAAQLRARCPQLRIVLVGDGAELGQLRARAQADGLTNVEFRGLADRQQAADCVAASDISLVVLRRADVFTTVLPSKMFESMAAGVPQVMAVDGEARRLLERANAGLAVPPEDVSALVEAIVRLAGDPALRSALGASGRAFVEREFDRAVWAGRYLSILDGMAGTGVAPLLEPAQRTTK